MSDIANIDLDKWNTAAPIESTESVVARPIVDHENEFCCHLAVQESLIYFLQEGVSDELLFQPTARAIFRFAKESFSQSGKAPTQVMLFDEFPSYDWADPQTTAQWITDKLRDRYKRGEVQSTIRSLAEKSSDPHEAFVYMREKVYEIERTAGSSRNIFGPQDTEYFLAQYREEQLKGFTKGFTTGFRQVDEVGGGVRPGQLAFYLARPKRMKSFFLCHAAIGQAMDGHNVLIDTMELSPYEMWGRVSCMMTGLSYNTFVQRQFTDRQFEIIHRAWEKFEDGTYGRIHMAQPPPGERTVSHLSHLADKLDVQSIVIDQLSFLEPPKDYYHRADLATSDIVYGLKNLAGTAGKERPIICAAQFNREAASMDDIADVSKAALSGAIEQVADALYGLHRSKDMKENKVIEFGLLESRASDTGNFMISYELKSETRFQLSEVL